MGIRIPQHHPLPTAPEPAPRPARRPGPRRWLYHIVLAAAFVSGGGALLVWPQWVALDGATTTLQIQQDREQELSERLDGVRAGVGRLRLWDRGGRRVFLADELSRYPVLAQAVAKRAGATVARVEVTQARPSRWRAVTLDKSGGDVNDTAGEIRPQLVRVVVKGGFDAVYRTIAGLTQQQQLFVPERWDVSGGPRGDLRAEVLGTVFVVHQPEEEPETPAPASSSVGPVARRISLEGEG